MLILARARGFSGCLLRAAPFQNSPTITAVFDPRYFSVDSRNENLPKKRIRQSYAWIAVPVRPSGSVVTVPSRPLCPESGQIKDCVRKSAANRAHTVAKVRACPIISSARRR